MDTIYLGIIIVILLVVLWYIYNVVKSINLTLISPSTVMPLGFSAPAGTTVSTAQQSLGAGTIVALPTPTLQTINTPGTTPAYTQTKI